MDGLDLAEYEPDVHVPEFAPAEDLVVEPDGTRVPARTVQAAAARELVTTVAAKPRSRARGGPADGGDHRQRAEYITREAGAAEAQVEDSADFVLGNNCAGLRPDS